MNPQLKDGVDPPAGLALDFLERIEVPGVDDERLLADRVGAHPQREADMGVVQVVRRADTHVVDPVRFRPAPQLFEVTVEAFDLGEEADVEREAIQDADRVVRVSRSDQPVAGILNCLEVTGGHKTTHAGDREIFLAITSLDFTAHSQPFNDSSTVRAS